ncbi:MAG: GMC family oxidoreductase [Caulobacterales bacterium]
MFDIVIIGAGSAGCAIAARASEDPNRTVLLIEAGPDYSQIAETPFDLVNGHNNSYTDHDWALSYAPTRGRQVRFPRGRVTGGSSAVNTAIALRGMPEDYDEWAQLGNPEWEWAKVLPAFNRLERDLDFGERDYHGDAGPISIRRYPVGEMARQHQAFLEAARGLGYPDCPDANDPNDWGSGPQPMNKLGRLRVSCAIGYLAPARARSNLTIRAQTFVTRLIIVGGKCTGVEVRTAEGEIEIIEGRLVVLCAGAILSPAILMRSGVGPRAQLEAHGIEVARDTPGVGQNLCDHPALSVSFEAKDPALVDPSQPIIQSILRYTAEGSNKRNDLQIEMLTFNGRPGSAPTFGIAGVVEYQYGRGELTLQSADPDVGPLIDNRFCEDERDLSRLVGCYKDVLAFAETAPIKEMASAMAFPRGEVDDEAIAGLCRRYAGSGYHPSGTVKMGPASDPMAVVGQYGACHGVDQLVVADASIMPFVPRANTNLTAIMIGERVGEWLRTRPGMYGL